MDEGELVPSRSCFAGNNCGHARSGGQPRAAGKRFQFTEREESRANRGKNQEETNLREKQNNCVRATGLIDDR